jgi:hypothetical protein
MAVSFSNDISPLFNQFKGQMMWRFDLTNYEHVKQNAQLILTRLQGGGNGPMPPPPFDPLTLEQVQMFETWVSEGCPP